MNNNEIILNYLKELIPNPVCELNYNKDYELLIAVMLSAQTTDKRVNKVTKELFKEYDCLEKLASSTIEDISSYIKELGNYRKKSYAVIEIAKILLSKHNGKVPDKRNLLEELPMVGRKTANVVLSTLFNIPNIAVDTHVTRVSKRLGIAKIDDDVLEIEKKIKRKFKKEEWVNLHLRLVMFGRYHCLARNPKCIDCKLKDICKEKNKNLK